MKHLKRLKVGSLVLNMVLLTHIFIRLAQLPLPFLRRPLVWLLLYLVVVIALAYTIGEIIDRIETIYLKGKYLSKNFFETIEEDDE